MKNKKIELKEKKAEAILRMKVMQLLPKIIKEFEKDNILYYSERMGVPGILYWISNNPEWVEYIKRFEDKYNALVYHAELSHTEFGRLLTLFYVNNHQEEWAQDFEDLIDGYACCYVWNIDGDAFSEFGTITFKPANGGIMRTG